MRTLPAHNRQPGAALVALGAQNFDGPHLAGGGNMGAAAGAQVGPAGIYQPHRTVNFFFAAVGQFCKVFRRGVPAAHRGVRTDHRVGLGFCFGQLAGGQRNAHIHPHRGGTDVKAHILRPKQAVQSAA